MDPAMAEPSFWSDLIQNGGVMTAVAGFLWFMWKKDERANAGIQRILEMQHQSSERVLGLLQLMITKIVERRRSSDDAD